MDANLSSGGRRHRLKDVARIALQLAEAAAEGQSDYFIASQLALVTRHFAKVVLVPCNYETLDAVLDFLGASIQTEVGRAHKLQGTPAHKAVEAIHETAMQATAGGSHGE